MRFVHIRLTLLSLLLLTALTFPLLSSEAEDSSSGSMLTYSITSYLPTKDRRYQPIASYQVMIYEKGSNYKLDLLSRRKLTTSLLNDGRLFLIDHINKTLMRLQDETKPFSTIQKGISAGKAKLTSFKGATEEVRIGSFSYSEGRARNAAILRLKDAKIYTLRVRGEIAKLPNSEPMLWGKFGLQMELVCSPELRDPLNYAEVGGYLILFGANSQARRALSERQSSQSELSRGEMINLMKRYVVIKVAPLIVPLAIIGYSDARLESELRARCLLSYALFQIPLKERAKKFLMSTMRIDKNALGILSVYVRLQSLKELNIPEKLFQLPDYEEIL